MTQNILRVLLPKLAADVRTCQLQSGLVTFVNPYSYARLRAQADLLSRFDRVGVDGMALVWMFKPITRQKVRRVSFDMTSLAPPVLRAAAEQRATVYLIGGYEADIRAARIRLEHAFPSLRIAGCRCGYFGSDVERQTSLQEIVDLAPHIVLVGMGTPVQERYLVDLWQAGWRGAGYTCGGFFHQAAKKLDYYPSWVDRANLRWLYRMWDEPYLVWRYGVDYPLAAIAFLGDALQYAIRR